MISQEQADKIVAANNLRDAVELLGWYYDSKRDLRFKRSNRKPNRYYLQ